MDVFFCRHQLGFTKQSPMWEHLPVYCPPFTLLPFTTRLWDSLLRRNLTWWNIPPGRLIPEHLGMYPVLWKERVYIVSPLRVVAVWSMAARPRRPPR